MKKIVSLILSAIMLITLNACTKTDGVDNNSLQTPQTTTSAITTESDTTSIISTSQDESHNDSTMPAPFEHQDGGGGDGHGNYIHWGNDKFMSIPGNFWDRFAEYLGETEIIEELLEWKQAREEGITLSYVTGIMDFQNIYSLAIINDIPVEIVIEAMDESNEITADIAMRLYGIEVDEDDHRLYTKEDKSVLLTQDEATILAHFASPYAIVIGDKVYTPAWLYTHTVEGWHAVGITPQMFVDMLPLYAELSFTNGAITAFESKLSEFMNSEVSLAVIRNELS
jgi:hypothetical protein